MAISTSRVKNQLIAYIQTARDGLPADTTILESLDKVEELRRRGYSLREVSEDMRISYHRARTLAAAVAD